MNRWIIGGGVALAAISSTAWAGQDFCAGFTAGWAAAFQNHNKMVALTPLCPLPPLGGDTFQVGYERGLTAGLGYIAAH